MSKQSSVEYAIDELCKIILFYGGDEQNDNIATIKEQAKVMHRKEIQEAYVYGAAYQIDIKNGLSPIFYYNERFEK